MAFNQYTTKKARLEHQCAFCMLTIEQGEQYHTGYFQAHGAVKLCAECYQHTGGNLFSLISDEWLNAINKRRPFIPRPKQVKGAMRTYVAREQDGNCPSLLIRATSPSKATYLAYQEYGFVSYTDIRVNREPRADSFIHREGIIEDTRLKRSLGWCPANEASLLCEGCDQYEFSEIPESKVDESTMLCKECRDKGVILNDTL